MRARGSGRAGIAPVTVALPASRRPTIDAQTGRQASADSKWHSGTLLQLAGRELLDARRRRSPRRWFGDLGVRRGADRQHPVGRAAVLRRDPDLDPGQPVSAGIVGRRDRCRAAEARTTVDTSRPIRCFGEPRGQSSFVELTGGNWAFNGFSGHTARRRSGTSLTGNAASPAALGSARWPAASCTSCSCRCKSTQQLVGAGRRPAGSDVWSCAPSGTTATSATTSVWTNVVAAAPTGRSSTSRGIRRPAVLGRVADRRLPTSSAELFANLYSAGTGRARSARRLYEPDRARLGVVPTLRSARSRQWNGAVTSASDTWQVTAPGPNGGTDRFDRCRPSRPTFTMRLDLHARPAAATVRQQRRHVHDARRAGHRRRRRPGPDRRLPGCQGLDRPTAAATVDRLRRRRHLRRGPSATAQTAWRSTSSPTTGHDDRQPPTTPTTPDDDDDNDPADDAQAAVPAPKLMIRQGLGGAQGLDHRRRDRPEHRVPGRRPVVPGQPDRHDQRRSGGQGKKKKPKPLTVGSAHLTIAPARRSRSRSSSRARPGRCSPSFTSLTIALTGSATARRRGRAEDRRSASRSRQEPAQAQVKAPLS